MNDFGKLADRRRLTRQRLMAWLEARDGMIVGTVGSYRDCPLANFLREECGATNPAVLPIRYTLNDRHPGPARYRPMPLWARAFVEGVDSGYAGDPILAREALYALRSAIRRTAR